MSTVLKTFPKSHLTLAAAATIAVTAAALMSPSSDVEAKRMSYPVDLSQGTVSGSGAPVISAQTSENTAEQAVEIPAPSNSVEQALAATKAPPAAIAAPEAPKVQWKEFRIKSGDTLSSLFKKAGFNDGVMLSVIHGEGEADKLQRLYAGEDIRFGLDDEGDLVAIELQRSRLESLKIEKTENGYAGETERKQKN